MRRYFIGLAILALALLGAGAIRADDQEIAEQIVQKLQAEKQAGTLKGFSVDLEVDEGTVWMSGRVSTEAQQMKVLDIARRIPGVTQVVNDLEVTTASAARSPTRTAQDAFGNMSRALASAVRREPLVKQAAATQEVTAQPMQRGAIGSGVAQSPSPARVAAAHPIQPIAAPAQNMPAPQGYYAQPVPVYAGSQQQVPLAFAQARPAQHEGMVEGVPGAPVPMYLPGSGVGIAPARYDHPSMPGYAWPSYAAYPNYAAVTYPKQYSPTAWPYIGPFYPYPQVPLGWRKVTLEWDDGWWMLDFKDRRTMYNH
jgi:hypothetical protein